MIKVKPKIVINDMTHYDGFLNRTTVFNGKIKDMSKSVQSSQVMIKSAFSPVKLIDNAIRSQANSPSRIKLDPKIDPKKHIMLDIMIKDNIKRAKAPLTTKATKPTKPKNSSRVWNLCIILHILVSEENKQDALAKNNKQECSTKIFTKRQFKQEKEPAKPL